MIFKLTLTNHDVVDIDVVILALTEALQTAQGLCKTGIQTRIMHPIRNNKCLVGYYTFDPKGEQE